MDRDGTQDTRGTADRAIPRPAGPPPLVPPPPQHRPDVRTPVAEWLDAPRAEAGPGIWRFRYTAPPPPSPSRKLAPETVLGLAIPLIVGVILLTLWAEGLFPYKTALIRVLTPDDWWYAGTVWPRDNTAWEPLAALHTIDRGFYIVVVCVMGYLGSWTTLFRHLLARWQQPTRAVITAVSALVMLALVWPRAFPLVDGNPLPIADTVFTFVALVAGGWEIVASPLVTFTLRTLITLAVLYPFARAGDWIPLLKQWRSTRAAGPRPSATPTTAPRSQWPDLRDVGQHEAADLLASEVVGGRMNDVDCTRVSHAFAAARRDAELAGFRDTVLRYAGAAWTHPSGQRDLGRRDARHDLLVGQVRIGRWVAGERAPRAYHDAGAALGPEVLGTSLLAVGPSGSGKTRTLVEPVTEALALQALTGRCAVVAVSAPGRPLGADAAFDVVVRIGDPASVYDLDPYADSDDPDEAADILAEALVGDLDTVGGQSAATALAQLLGPYRAAHGRFPTLPELRELLEGEESALSALREALAARGDDVMRRELDARVRQTGTPGDAGRALADRLALLNRPVFADFFGGGTARPFSLRAIAHHPLRVRIDLPERGHEEAGRLITRLVLAQFHTVVRHSGRAHFAGLVLDDATGAVTAESVRRIQRLRSQNAGVLLTLRSVGDVPEALHGPLYGAVGCRMAFCGITTWDGSRFAQTWGTEWVETTEVAKHTVFADQPMTRAIHALRKLVTGKAVTTDAVTVRQVERERWSASQLAHEVPPGHAVLSLTRVDGEHTPPLLVDLRG
ncbi:ATP/GTP-binding protein [Streptomyces sp. NPDC018693]|uniref:ATP/GTP-binding protein n=1 Tax=unclassified Streptomyces TaxID=2593676 RepID=UPI0037AC9CD1